MGKTNSPNISDSIPNFNGTANITEYIRHFEAKIKILKYSEVQSFKLLASKLTEVAFERFILNQDSITTYEQLKTFLLNAYAIKRKKFHTLNALFSLKQREDEHIESFFLRVTFALNDTNTADFNSNTESGKIFLFGYISQNMKYSLKSKLPNNFDPIDLDDMMISLKELDSYDDSFIKNVSQMSTPVNQSHLDKSDVYYTPHPNFQTLGNKTNFSQCDNFETPHNFRAKSRRRLPHNVRFQPYHERNIAHSNEYNTNYSPHDTSSKNRNRQLAIAPPW